MVNKSRLRWVGYKLGYKNYVQNFILKRAWLSGCGCHSFVSGQRPVVGSCGHTTLQEGHTWGQGGRGKGEMVILLRNFTTILCVS